MKVTTIQEAKEMVGQIVPAISATVTKVYPLKTGQTKAGDPYALQNIEIKDATGTIKLTLSGREELSKDAEGHNILLESVKTKHGLQGVKVVENEYNNAKHIELRLTPSGNLVCGVGANPPEDKDPFPPRDPEPPKDTDPRRGSLPQSSVSGKQLVNNRLGQYGELAALCSKKAKEVGLQEFLTDEQVHALTSTFIIQGFREGLDAKL